MSAQPVSPKSDAQPADNGGGAIFRGLLDGSLAHGAAKTAGNAKLAQVPATVDGALAQHVKELLDKGLAPDAVVKKLADALAAQVAALLGITPQAAQAQLAQAFTQAFGTAGTGPPGETNAQRAAALVSTLRRIAEAATRVTSGEPGTPIRLIAGQRSDADTAKASPTPPTSPTDRLLRGALDALAGSASPAVTTLAPVPAPASGDGRTVALGGASALASGGDTLLGRTLARAVLADQQRSAAADAASAGALTPAPATAPAASGSTNSAVEAFLNAFAGALAQADANGAGGSSAGGDGRHDPSGSDPLGAAAPAAAPDQPATPFALAFGQPATPTDPALPAPAAAAAPGPAVDPSAVVDQLVRGMQVHTADGVSELRMRLDPAQLGDLSVKLVVSGGAVDASITASSAAARDALASGQAQLARTLADAGLKLQSFTVGLAGGGFGQREQSPHHAWGGPSPRRIGGLGPLEPDEPADDLGLLAVPSFGPPLVSGLRGYDYLV